MGSLHQQERKGRRSSSNEPGNLVSGPCHGHIHSQSSTAITSPNQRRRHVVPQNNDAPRNRRRQRYLQNFPPPLRLLSKICMLTSRSNECGLIYIWDRRARDFHHGRVDADTKGVVSPEASAAGGVRERVGGWADYKAETAEEGGQSSSSISFCKEKSD